MPTGERRQVSILFADFSEFTSFSARLDPEDLRDTMNALWARVDAIIKGHRGTPEKHSGDAIMAVFGAWRSREEDPAEAVRAALAIQDWLKSERSDPGRTALQMRIGIHTGVVVVGPADHSGEFLATGDAVNLACRLEQNAPVGGVLVSRETYSQTPAAILPRALRARLLGDCQPAILADWQCVCDEVRDPRHRYCGRGQGQI
jgi:class 3 adenylate cyclase